MSERQITTRVEQLDWQVRANGEARGRILLQFLILSQTLDDRTRRFDTIDAWLWLVELALILAGDFVIRSERKREALAVGSRRDSLDRRVEDRRAFLVGQPNNHLYRFATTVSRLVRADANSLGTGSQITRDGPAKHLSPQTIMQSIATQESKAIRVAATQINDPASLHRLPTKKGARFGSCFFIGARPWDRTDQRAGRWQSLAVVR